ncbi:unnamed protein product [Adineta ricciae]|uniref:Uncharacterized protein n=1 Tax=Adineta ricciae TaxID=249248 RepID=A0A815EDD1_ADIRI|nr:unnamed protein product [Adineta ricciae]CAF1346920.1 unnamed protein product [Adineta ricciae]
MKSTCLKSTLISFYSQKRTSFLLCKTPVGILRYAILCFLLVIILFTFVFEFYYRHGQCAVAENYSKKNMKLTHQVMNMFDDLSIAYWPDCQSLLNVLRNETYNVWDHDVDLSIEWPFESNYIHSELNDINFFIEKFEEYGFVVEYYPNRQLLSLSSPDKRTARQAHVDIWLWTRRYENDRAIVLQLLDYSFKYQSRLFSDVYPLKSAAWLGRNINIPIRSHKIAYIEFGASYPKARVFRRDCFHNLFNLRWL